VPDPLSGVTVSLEKAETRRVLSAPGPFNTFPDTVQPVAVSPPACTGAVKGEKEITFGSKVKSPWKPT
jgi:hypothetical protein